MAETDDWRLTDQEDYLAGITLVRLVYEQWSENWDHDHCAFCWAKFMPLGTESNEPVEHDGYTNEDVPGRPDHYWWICQTCFDDFRDRFDWKVRPAS